MFVLRIEHEEAFGRAGLNRFAEKAVRMLRQDYGDLSNALDGNALRKLVDECMAFARENGLRTELQMYRVIAAGLIRLNGAGRNDTKSSGDVRRILADASIDPDERANAVLELVKNSTHIRRAESRGVVARHEVRGN